MLFYEEKRKPYFVRSITAVVFICILFDSFDVGS